MMDNAKSLVRSLVASSFVSIALFLLLASSASANLEFKSTAITLTRAGGGFEFHAGAHPDLTFGFKLPEVTEELVNGETFTGPPESVKTVDLELPPGMIGNPTAAPTCTTEQFFINPKDTTFTGCPLSTQIGTVKGSTKHGPNTESFYVPLFNVAHGPDVPARFGFVYLGVPVFISASVRADDFGITSGAANAPQTEPVQETEVKIWGVPAEHAHDTERVFPGSNLIFGIPFSSEAPPKPFMRNPTSCPGTPATFTAIGDSWQHPGLADGDIESHTSDASGTPFIFEGCNELPFQPTLNARPTVFAAEAPTGLVVDLNVPQNEAIGGYATSDVRQVRTTLPLGMSVSDSSASGLGSCSTVQISLASNDPPACPDSSKLGTVRIRTPLLEEELEGGVYLAKQNENPFGSLLALYIAVKGPGFYLKLPGRVDADPGTGQLTATFENTPQLPFEHLSLELKSGPRAPLMNPQACGTYGVKSELVPWSGTDPVLGESKFTISEGCSTGGFAPGLKAGTASPAAGQSSPFTLQVTRKDGEQNLSAIDATLPQGLLAKLAGVPLCGDPAASSGSCPAASQIGTTTVGAGPGASPIYVPEPGKAPTAVYLAGPYKGAPYSLVVKVPAQAGPFDLGTVAVRSGIYVDPTTTAVSVKSDPLPQILQGIPVAYRDVRVEINRPDFTLNPTNCKAQKVTTSIAGSGGATATPSAPFQASGCEALAFKPSLALSLKGSTKHAGHPALKAVLTYPAKGAYANIARAQVNLPHSLFLEQGNLNKTCTRPVLLAGNCPASSIYGKAKASTPLLDRPLEGPVYLVGGYGYKLPALVADLNGQIRVTLVGKVDSGPNKGLRNTFEAVPDAPVSRFELQFKGGKKYSLLANSEDLCKSPQKAIARFTAQNGKVLESKPVIKTSCGKGKPKSKAKNK